MSIGQELLNVPMGDMIREMALAIAEGQRQLDENSVNVAEMMGGLTAVYDEKGKITFDDSRVFFGYEYMTVAQAREHLKVDDQLSGNVVKLKHVLGYDDDDENDYWPEIEDDDAKGTMIRVPTRVSMLELGFTPTFYQFVDTIIEVRIAIKMTSRSQRSVRSTRKSESRRWSHSSRRSFWGTYYGGSSGLAVSTTQVDASYASRYGYSAEGASLLRTKLTPIPPPAVLEDRVRQLMEAEEEQRQQRQAKEQKTQENDEGGSP